VGKPSFDAKQFLIHAKCRMAIPVRGPIIEYGTATREKFKQGCLPAQQSI
jgi:hypothetical protein